MVVYGYFFWDRIAEYWFNPAWTSDDALQQLYPFHKVFHPELFKDDLITAMIEGYLPPIHYALSYGVTWLTGDPIMMGHWLMLMQIGLTLGFLFFAVKRAGGFAAACLAVTWMLHTRHTMQRLTAGLPRGWAAPVFAAYFFFALRGNHRGMLATLFVGCLLHPPATFVIALAYGMYLLVRFAMPETRVEYRKPLIHLMLISPVLLVMTLKVLHRDERIGSMVTYQEALEMPEFQRPLGRFPFVPLRPAWEEIKSVSFQAFVSRFYYPGKFWKREMHWIVLALTLLLLCAAQRSRRRVVPLSVVTFVVASFLVYFLSRALAFKLYVPDRHLQIPGAFIWITFFTIAIARLCVPRTMLLPLSEIAPFPRLSTRHYMRAAVLFLMLAALVSIGNGLGLNGAMNFNFTRTKKGHAWGWLKQNTPLDSLVAGHPTHLDSVFLFGARQGYVTTEVAHPFYQAYNREMQRRLEISLRAHYSRSWAEFLQLVEAEGIDYFVFARRAFYPEELAKERYFPPLDGIVRDLASHPVESYLYKRLPAEVVSSAPYMPFKDGWSAVLDVKRVREFFDRGMLGD
jgi:hypothetical protein